MKKLTTATFSSFLLFTNISIASTSGIYAGLAAGTSSLDLGDDSDIVLLKKEGVAARVFGGYRFNPYFGLEASYAQLNNQNFAFTDYPGFAFNYKLSALSLFGKLYLPFNQRFNVNFSLGGAQLYGDVATTSIYNTHNLESTNGFVVGGGIGAEILLTEKLAANIDFISFDDKEGDYSHLPLPASRLFTAGFTYLF